MRPDAFGICLLKQTASGAQSVTSPSKIEGFREFEADLSALFYFLIFLQGGILFPIINMKTFCEGRALEVCEGRSPLAHPTGPR